MTRRIETQYHSEVNNMIGRIHWEALGIVAATHR
ncbi:hypothetical protein MPL3356_340193 [Mesorhizobium plurifarium]|uniref:Uncharacterized protein n=1 Tax=Mesorhizobium plurifarium TaxID=69974 RepID=A0A090DVQ4_MESPL|nr:hypothetical protein MPL3356_340193 [Mesorhizobium plurifarium]